MQFEEIDNFFGSRAVTPEEEKKQQAVNEAARTFAKIIHSNTPRSADQTAAVRKVREARDLAFDAIVLKGAF